jgi:WD repeat-containing protein 35
VKRRKATSITPIAAQIVGIEWYDGLLGYAEPNCPVLAICLDNGRMQLMRSESDDNAVCIDTGIKPVKCKWNCNGTILAVAGFQLGGSSQDARELWMVQVMMQDADLDAQCQTKPCS